MEKQLYSSIQSSLSFQVDLEKQISQWLLPNHEQLIEHDRFLGDQVNQLYSGRGFLNCKQIEGNRVFQISHIQYGLVLYTFHALSEITRVDDRKTTKSGYHVKIEWERLCPPLHLSNGD